MSVCFQRMPKSSSWMQIALRITCGSPKSSGTVASRYAISPRQSQPRSSELVHLPSRYSPAVEVRLPVPEPRVAVRHDHLGDGRPVDDRPGPAGVVQADLVQDQALARVEADPHGPALPAQPVAVQGEARPLRLGDLDRPQAVPQRAAHRRVVVVAGLGGHRTLELVDDLEHLALDQVDVRGDPVHGVRPDVVVLALLAERQHPDEPAVVVALAERPRGLRQRPDLGDVGQPAPGHRRPPLRVGADHVLDHAEVLVDDRQLAVGCAGRAPGATPPGPRRGTRPRRRTRPVATSMQERPQPPVRPGRPAPRPWAARPGRSRRTGPCRRAGRPRPGSPARPGTRRRSPGRADARAPPASASAGSRCRSSDPLELLERGASARSGSTRRARCGGLFVGDDRADPVGQARVAAVEHERVERSRAPR